MCPTVSIIRVLFQQTTPSLSIIPPGAPAARPSGTAFQTQHSLELEKWSFRMAMLIAISQASMEILQWRD